jgi:hypothetical protein
MNDDEFQTKLLGVIADHVKPTTPPPKLQMKAKDFRAIWDNGFYFSAQDQRWRCLRLKQLGAERFRSI